MWLNAMEVKPDGGILLPSDICNKMGLTVGDYVALIYVDNHVIMKKVTSGNGRMTFGEFLNYRDVKIKNHNPRKKAIQTKVCVARQCNSREKSKTSF